MPLLVFEADGLGEELLHHAFLVVLQQGFLLDQLPNPPIHRRQEIGDFVLLIYVGNSLLSPMKLDSWIRHWLVNKVPSISGHINEPFCDVRNGSRYSELRVFVDLENVVNWSNMLADPSGRKQCDCPRFIEL